MRKAQKRQAEELVRQMEEAHGQIKKYMEGNNLRSAMGLLEDCQSGGISLGTLIEETEGEGHPAVSLLEEYCELVYRIYENLSGEDGMGEEGEKAAKAEAAWNAEKLRNAEKTWNAEKPWNAETTEKMTATKAHKLLRQKLLKIENCIRNEIKIRVEAVFLPYKASMWDSLESVWQAAEADPDCDAYVIPIPYYDRNPDGSFGRMHYEGDRYPAEVPVTAYDTFDFAAHRPDMIFIHNPYDNYNFVTSVHPFFYSDKLKKYTDCLVYIPYYATAGGMSEGQAMCAAYVNVDYIVIQSEQYRKFFDGRIPDEKFLAFGSPKFDSVIRKCQNPPEVPEEWKAKMERREGDRVIRKKVYFYNTSIGGMLADTDAFLRKMRYVFDVFKGREDACLLWRPHPLMESTFDSMRREYRARYDGLKKAFVEEDLGILDETDDIEKTIALSDVYVGDSGTSVTSLFGVAGKPLFILNNYIHSLPEGEDWRGERVKLTFDMWGDDRYQVTENNQLWFSEKNDYHYRFYMDLGTGYSGGGYYMKAVEKNGKIYVLPRNAQHILVIENGKIRKLQLKDKILQGGIFYNYYYNEKYIFLFPLLYPYVVRLDLEGDEVCYIDGIQRFNVRNIKGEWRVGAVKAYDDEIVFASPEDSQFIFMNMDTLKVRMLCSHSVSNLGTQGIVPNGDGLWLLPLNGMVITYWNPKTGEVREYGDLPKQFQAVKWPYEKECQERPFGGMVFSQEGGRENIVISPTLGNMYLSLNRESGKMEEWETPVPFTNRGKNGYFLVGGMGGFVVTIPQYGKADCRIWYAPERKLYDININTKECREIEIEFNYSDLKAREPGFMARSETMQFCLEENAMNSLKNLLDGHITGKQFDREKQLKAFSHINANTDGICGQKIYTFFKQEFLW